MAWIRSHKKGSGGVIPIALKFQNGTTGNSTYTITEDGIYLIAVVFSLSGSGTITLPDGRSADYSGDVIITSGGQSGMRLVVAHLYAGDVVTMSTTVSNWVANAKIVIKIPFAISSMVDSAKINDNALNYTLSTGSGTVLCLMTAWARIQTSGATSAYMWDQTPVKEDMDCIAGVVGTNCILRVFTCDVADFPSIKAYGYDGGGVTVAVMQ